MLVSLALMCVPSMSVFTCNNLFIHCVNIKMILLQDKSLFFSTYGCTDIAQVLEKTLCTFMLFSRHIVLMWVFLNTDWEPEVKVMYGDVSLVSHNENFLFLEPCSWWETQSRTNQFGLANYLAEHERSIFFLESAQNLKISGFAKAPASTQTRAYWSSSVKSTKKVLARRNHPHMNLWWHFLVYFHFFLPAVVLPQIWTSLLLNWLNFVSVLTVHEGIQRRIMQTWSAFARLSPLFIYLL